MKNNFTKLMAIVAVLLMSAWSVNAQTELRFVANASSTTSYTFNTTDVLYAVDGTSFSTNTSTPCFTGETFQKRIQQKVFILELKSTSCSAITLHGTSSGTTSTRTIYKIEVADTKDGTYTEVENITNPTTTITSNIYGTATCGESSATNLNIAQGKFVKISICTSASSTTVQNINLAGIDITALPSGPKISKFVAEGVEATINESAKTITAELPYGSSLTSISPTVTIGGTATDYLPKGAQDFTNPVIYTATDGTNNVDYTVTLTVNPTPSSDKDLSNVTIGGKTPTFDANTNTYSIILPKASSLTQTVSFTKPSTATANFTSGNTHDFTNPLTITVTAQDASTKVYTLTAQAGIADIAYVSTAATPHANDTKIYPMLIEKGYYVNVIAASGTDLTQFNPYDLVVLCENVSSSNTLALAMNGLIKTKRFLNFKAFMYGKTGWPTGTPSDGTSDADVAIDADYLGHPIFSGVTLTGNLANILTAPAAKGVQGVLNPQENVSSKIAYLTSSGNTDKVALIENNQMPTAKYLMIPIQTDSYAKVNANGLKLIENAITYLLTDTKFGPYTGVTKNNLTNISFVGRTILNPERQQLYVYDATGRLVASSVQDINMNAQAKGIYLVKGENGIMKIAVTN